MQTSPDSRFVRLPIIAGPIVLATCWIVFALVANAQHASCWGGFDLKNIAGPLALDYKIGYSLSPALPLLVYAAQSVASYLMLFVGGLIAFRLRSKPILVAISVFGTLVLSAFFCIAYAASYPDIFNGGMLCDLGFELVPYAGIVLTLALIAAGSLIGRLIGRRNAGDP